MSGTNKPARRRNSRWRGSGKRDKRGSHSKIKSRSFAWYSCTFHLKRKLKKEKERKKEKE